MQNDGGLARFQRRMQAIPKEVRDAVQPATLKGAEEMAAAMRQLAPERSGALKDSISVTGPGKNTPPYSHPGGSRSVPENAAAVTAGDTNVRYAHLVEFGTNAAQAQPFFWPAFRVTRKRATNRIKRAMTKAVKENWGSR
ncbi:MAG: HK97-gp10 family putative phage morphogenesis protein [Pseudomonadota bacterium]